MKKHNNRLSAGLFLDGIYLAEDWKEIELIVRLRKTFLRSSDEINLGRVQKRELCHLFGPKGLYTD
jgi:hypothetical protein